MSVLRKAATALLGLATLFPVLATPAQAGERERNFVYGAVAGVAGAAIIGGLARDRHGPVIYEERYYEPVYRPVYQPVYRRPVYREPVYRTVRHRPAYRSLASNHVAYCQGRYRSYDVRTDTYQPNHGPRRVCTSPYG